MKQLKILAALGAITLLTACSRTSPPADIVYDNTPTSYHIVKAGDSIGSIAQRYKMNKNELAKLNGLRPPHRLIVGQKLLVIKRGQLADGSPAVNDEPTTTHSVGETGGVTVEKLSAPEGIEDAAKPLETATKDFDVKSPLGTPESVEEGVGAPEPDTGKPVKASANDVDSKPVPTSSGQMIWPVKGRVVKEFTTRADKRGNDGINIAAPLGTDVVAADNGVVARSGNQLRGFGNFVLIKHNGGIMSVYTHLGDVAVKDGDTIQRGQKIGTVGKTGQVQEPQIHFEVRRNKTPIDPKTLLQ